MNTHIVILKLLYGTEVWHFQRILRQLTAQVCLRYSLFLMMNLEMKKIKHNPYIYWASKCAFLIFATRANFFEMSKYPFFKKPLPDHPGGGFFNLNRQQRLVEIGEGFMFERIIFLQASEVYLPLILGLNR